MRIVAKLMMEHFFIDQRSKSMDPRGMYIIQTEDSFRILIGNECKGRNREAYLEYARSYISQIQIREKGAETIIEINQDDVNEDFFSLWKLESVPETPFARIPAWNMSFIDVSLLTPVERSGQTSAKADS